MSKLIKIYECPAWCKKRGIEPHSHQCRPVSRFSEETNSFLACLDQHQFLFHHNDNREYCFKMFCPFPTIKKILKINE